MNIGIVLFIKGFGGTYQYSITLLESLNWLKNHGMKDKFIIFTPDLDHPVIDYYKKKGWQIEPLYPNKFTLILQLLKRKFSNGPKVKKSIINNRNQEDWFKKFGIDLMIYPTSHPFSFEAKIPYIVSIHDLQHRLQPEFPEVSANGEWGQREYQYQNAIKNATIVIAESKVGKEDILKFYKDIVNSNRIEILPYLPPSYLKSKDFDSEKDELSILTNLPKRYLFYPAQFWPHKNHLRIIEALGSLKKNNKLDVPIVFTGSHTGNVREEIFNELNEKAANLGIEKNIFYLGYIDDKYMKVLYKHATALVMPTFFGPTNIPILEAWSLNCPVITSDIRGVRDQAGDAALLVDQKSSESIAAAILKIWTNKKLREDLVLKGKKQLALYTQGDYNKHLRSIINKAKKKLEHKNG